jgi:hypothetical protein
MLWQVKGGGLTLLGGVNPLPCRAVAKHGKPITRRDDQHMRLRNRARGQAGSRWRADAWLDPVQSAGANS